MEPVIVGIDPASTRLAAATVSGTPQRPLLLDLTKRQLTTKKWSPESTALAMDWAWDLLGHARSFGDPEVWIEEPVVGRSPRATVVQAFTSGAVQAALVYEGTPVSLVNVSTWKKELGRGSSFPSGKDAVQRLVGSQWPHAAAAADGDQDLIDAIAIALYGLGQFHTRRLV